MTPTTTTPRPATGRARPVVSILLAGGLAAAAAGCSGDSDAAQTTPAETVPETTDRADHHAAPDDDLVDDDHRRADHDGRGDDDDDRAGDPPHAADRPAPAYGQVPPDRAGLVVKIDNDPRARPQSGLNAADIVFEEIVEGGAPASPPSTTPRQRQPGRPDPQSVAPRTSTCSAGCSARCSSGAAATRASPGRSPTPTSSTSTRTAFPAARTGARATTAPRTTYYSDTDRLWALQTAEAGRPKPLFSYLEPGVKPTGRQGACGRSCGWTAATSSGSSSPEVGGYVRGHRTGPPTTTPTTNERINATTSSSSTLRTGRATSTGAAPRRPRSAAARRFVLSAGTLRTGSWLRDKRTDAIALFAADGSLIELMPGRTWVELRDPVDPAPSIS